MYVRGPHIWLVLDHRHRNRMPSRMPQSPPSEVKHNLQRLALKFLFFPPSCGFSRPGSLVDVDCSDFYRIIKKMEYSSFLSIFARVVDRSLILSSHGKQLEEPMYTMCNLNMPRQLETENSSNQF